jgi:hypothetical protein
MAAPILTCRTRGVFHDLHWHEIGSLSMTRELMCLANLILNHSIKDKLLIFIEEGWLYYSSS